MKGIALLVAFLAIFYLIEAQDDKDFDDFCAKNGKVYSNSAEKAKRKGIYAKRLKEIEKLNSDAKKKKENVDYGVTPFCDLETDEFINSYTGYKMSAESKERKVLSLDGAFNSSSLKQAVTEFDWTKQNGAVAPVKNQGNCGACWAFGAVAVLESFYARKTGTSVKLLSEQQVTNCNSPPNYGCGGGDHYAALKYLKSAGAALGSSYPYTGRNGGCQYSSANAFVKPNFFSNIYQTRDENKMMSLLQSNGPMSVVLDATVLQTYRSGVISSCSRNLNHVVTLVGFGTDSRTGQKFWRLKNSWGTNWGEAGFFRLLRNANTCGMASQVYYLG